MDSLPEGFTDQPTLIPAPPEATAAALPPGFDPAPMGAAPDGFSYENPLDPSKAQEPEKTNLQVPGFWNTVGSAFGRGATERVAADIAGAKVALPVGIGGKSLEEQYQEGLLHPETKDELDALLAKKVNEGWTDPKWWGAQIAHGTGSTTAGIGAAGVGALAGSIVGGGPAGAIAGFGLEGGLGTLVPAYKAARAAGLEPEEATTRALVDSGIATSVAVAMGLAPQVALYGKVINPAITDQVATMLRRPVMEMLTQLGLVQPSLAIAGHLATSLSHGEVPDPWDIATTGVVGAGMGVPIVGAHAAIRGMQKARAVPEAGPASQESIDLAFRNQNHTPPPEGFTDIAPGTVPPDVPPPGAGKPTVIRPEIPPAVPIDGNLLDDATLRAVDDKRRGEIISGGDMAEEQLYPKDSRESRIFFSPVRQAVEQRLPDNASVEQTVATIRNAPGVKQEEINDLQLPRYLAGLDGKVNKKDLLAHIEANAIDLREVRRGDPLISSLNEKEPEFAGQVIPGEHSNYREFVLKTPTKFEPDYAAVEDRAREIWDYNYEKDYGSWDMASEDARREIRKKATAFFFDEHPGVYTGSHWSDPNVIVHFRLTDRQDRNGRNMLHVEEIQSDLHQAGRKKGYLEPDFVPIDLKQAEERVTLAEHRYQSLKQSRERIIRQRSTLDAVREGNIPPGEAELRARQEWRAAIDNFQEGVNQRDEMGGRLPDLPFKTSWQELAVKRILQLAADEGYDAISWSNGDQVGLRGGTPEQVRGMRKSYDEIIPSLFAKWAKKLGMDIGTTKLDSHPSEMISRIPATAVEKHLERLQRLGLFDKNTGEFKINDLNKYVEVNPAAGSRIRQGLPLYEEDARPKRTLSDNIKRGLPKELVEPGKKLVQALGELGRSMKLSRGMQIIVGPDAKNRRGWVEGRLNSKGEYVVHINTRLLSTPQDVWATMGHEFGHVIYEDKWATAPTAVKLATDEKFRQFRETMNQQARVVGDVRRLRDNAVSEMTGARDQDNNIPLSDLQPRSRAYILHYKEWYAEQVAKWATTSEKPLGIVEKFFKEVGTVIRKLIEKFEQIRGRSAKAETVLQEWLDSLTMDSTRFADIKDQLDFETKRRNADAMARDGTPEVGAVPATASTVGGRNIIDSLPPDSVGPAGPAGAAHADRMNLFWKWMTSLPQIASANLHIRPLQIYKEIVATMNVERNVTAAQADSTLRAWRFLNKDPKQAFGLNKFIEDYMNGLFKDPSDMSGTIRRPTAAEFTTLARKHGLSDLAIKTFDRIRNDFDNFLEKYRQLLLADAGRIKDPLGQKKAIDEVNKRVDALLNRPFFPAMRFGKYTITVYDSAGNVRHFEQTETLRKQAQIKAALEKSSDILPGDRVRTGEVPKDAAPLLGMPPGLLDLMADKLDLSSTQRGMLDQLRFDYAPSQSFRHQFKTKDLTPGYSTDFQRAYANFFFHGANHMSRVKWVDALRDQIREVKAGSVEMNDAVKRDKIANYMTEHLSMLVDPKPDFAALRGLMFHWYLGFNPASATLNLTQTPIMTYPHLASKFGDVAAVRSLSKAGTNLNLFYKKAGLLDRGRDAPPGPTGAKMRALGEAVQEGVISETQAHTLAAVSENRNLLRAFGTKGEEFWQRFSEASSWMFEMTEQYNRRVAFDAAWELAMRDPNNKYVQETVRDNPLQYQRLKDRPGWDHQTASAFVAAKDSVEKTQFVYAPYARPKFMWGRKGSLFIFKSFVQNTLFNLYNNPSAAARSLIILGALGGLMGLPGMEDVNGILKSLAWHLFGKDFDLEDEARKFAIDVLKGTIGPDMLLHGTSTKGFGIPHVMNALGSQVGLPKWFPTLDRHGSIGMGNILPIEPGKMFGPSKDVKGNELAQLQRASGAGFSNIFAMYNFLTSQQDIKELKRWEQIMPRAASNVSHAFRYFAEGTEKNRSGNAIVRFDPHDTEQMAEILARAMGYQPRRLIARYEQIQAQQEAATYWDLRKQILLRQFAVALKGGNSVEKENVVQSIRNYNQELPNEAKAKAITAQTLKDSVTTRLKTQQKQEAGIPLAKQNFQLFKSMDKYFPEGRPTGQVDAIPVK